MSLPQYHADRLTPQVEFVKATLSSQASRSGQSYSMRDHCNHSVPCSTHAEQAGVALSKSPGPQSMSGAQRFMALLLNCESAHVTFRIGKYHLCFSTSTSTLCGRTCRCSTIAASLQGRISQAEVCHQSLSTQYTVSAAADPVAPTSTASWCA